MDSNIKILKTMLIESGIEKSEAQAEVDFILKYVLNLKFEDIILGKKIDENLFEKAFEVVKKRVLTKQPLMQILGFTIFMDNKFIVTKDTLIPRVETELLIKTCQNLVNKNSKVLDIGCGTGIISIMLNKLTNCHVDSCDISSEALKIAKANSQNLNTNVNFFQSDLFEHVHDKYDLIVSNPPYISIKEKDKLQKEVKDFEPHQALFANDEQGIDFYKKISQNSQKFLNKSGFLAFELGINQSILVEDLFLSNNFQNVNIYKDLNNIERVITAQKL
ncbi:MAG: peptide chain release factor N(5)-glutamine methyltransferase [Candidatus Gastranaerophilales bacterium]|nr:peptide chain release factor N(5)-glutamine methyltransferase [Candidatus Gastranaerophilales bacterium]